MLTIRRSGARVCWHLLCNNIFISAGTKKECETAGKQYASKYGLSITLS